MSASKTQTTPLEGIEAEQLWYVPDRRVRTRAAADQAIELANSVSERRLPDSAYDDTDLFIAMHTCAFRAVGRSRNRQPSQRERADWARHWRTLREYIVERNLGLVYAMLRRFASKNTDDDDLLSDGMLALTRAVDRFNPWRGFRFSTYACNVVARALMRRGKREQHYRQLFPVQFEASHEQPEELPDSEKGLYLERLTHALNHNLGELTDLESEILSRRFPHSQRSKMTFHEIGQIVGLSKERVRQIQNIALRKLRNALEADPVLR